VVLSYNTVFCLFHFLFWEKVLLCSPSQPQTLNPPALAPPSTGITDMHHHINLLICLSADAAGYLPAADMSDQMFDHFLWPQGMLQWSNMEVKGLKVWWAFSTSCQKCRPTVG
jgi:hypothetical protein